MYLTLGEFLLGLSTLFVFITLIVFAASACFLRRYTTIRFSDRVRYEQKIDHKMHEIHVKTEAIKQIIWRLNHRDIAPKVASIKGITDELILKRMPAMFQALDIASRPNHHNYVKLAILETEDFEECAKMLSKLTSDLETISRETWKEFEHLQE